MPAIEFQATVHIILLHVGYRAVAVVTTSGTDYTCIASLFFLDS